MDETLHLRTWGHGHEQSKVRPNRKKKKKRKELPEAFDLPWWTTEWVTLKFCTWTKIHSHSRRWKKIECFHWLFSRDLEPAIGQSFFLKTKECVIVGYLSKMGNSQLLFSHFIVGNISPYSLRWTVRAAYHCVMSILERATIDCRINCYT